MASIPTTTTPSSSLPEQDVSKVFRRFDTNGDGKISASELLALVRALGTDASDDDARKMMDEMDSDRDGFVDLHEFTAFFSRHGRGEADDDEDAQLMDAFKIYDLDGNGRISVKELHLVMKRLGDRCSEKDCAKMIKSVDADGDGTVDFHEFKRMMNAGNQNKD